MRQLITHYPISENRMFRIGAYEAGLISFGAALNVSVGYLVSVLKLPLYLDSIGTILISVLCGVKTGTAVGLFSIAVLSLTSAPTEIAYLGTAVIIALIAALLGRFGYLRSVGITILGGLILGTATATFSIPVTFYLFKGVSLAGTDMITAFLKTFGMPLWKCVIIGSYLTDILDKIAVSLISFAIVKSLPERTLKRMKL